MPDPPIASPPVYGRGFGVEFGGWRSGRELPMRRTRGPSHIVRYSHLGIQFALVVLLGIWGGAQLDKRLSTNLFTLIGTFAGAGIGFYFLYRETRRAASDDERHDR